MQVGRLYVDGNVIIETEDDAIRDRKRLAAEGAVNIAFALNTKNAIAAGPTVSVRGLTMADEEDLELALEEMEDTAKAAFTKLNHAERGDDDLIEASVVRAVRKLQSGFGRNAHWATFPFCVSKVGCCETGE